MSDRLLTKWRVYKLYTMKGSQKQMVVIGKGDILRMGEMRTMGQKNGQ